MMGCSLDGDFGPRGPVQPRKPMSERLRLGHSTGACVTDASQQLAPCPPHDRGAARPPPPPPPSNEPRRAHPEGVPQPGEAGPNPEQSCLLAEENSGGAGHTPSLAARQRSLDPRLMLRRFESAGAVFFASVDEFLDLTAFKTVGVAGEFLLDQLHQEVER